ncbi:MAG: sigma-70 family RNA polymerase sigma factor [Chloroflexi bacterium]|nr:MAG: sigma-70 family RNA polymerase sigma factor [Chloroflexota bacterium]
MNPVVKRGDTVLQMHELTEADLVVLARADDAEAFRLLLERYQPMALAIALHQVSQSETAQDLVQEAMLQTYLSLDRLRDVTRFKSWFYGIVLNVCRNWQRRHSSYVLSLDLWDEYQLFSGIADPYEMIEEHELRCAVQQAVQSLSVKNRAVMFLCYYEGLRLEEIATRLHLSLAAVKSRLHEGRNQLKKHLTPSYPELSLTRSSKRRRPTMLNMKLIKVVPQEQRALVVLLDLPGRRVLPLWLNPMEGFPLAVLLKHVSQREAPNEPSSFEFVSNLLRATGGTVQAVHIEELQDQLLYARLLLQSLNGNQEVKARLGDALALAIREGSPILVADEIVRRIGMSLPPGESTTANQQLDQVVETLTAKTPFPASPGLPRIKEPHNLQFTEGLQRWELRGTFLFDQSGTHWQDYICGTEATGTEPGTMSGYLKARVPQPVGFADLRQAILADDYRGKHALLLAEIKTVGVEQQAGVYLRVVDPGRTRTSEEREQVTFQGTQDWTRSETQIEVPADSVFLLFGMSLTGKGQIWIKNVRLESV